jgi:putative DNA primase/helicase
MSNLPDQPAERRPDTPTPGRAIPLSWLLPDPDRDITGPQAVYEAACKYVDAGLSVMPIAADGSKSPDHERLPRSWDEEQQRFKSSWKLFQMRLPIQEELQRWRDTGGNYGIAIPAGVVSGGAPGLGLEIIDLDNLAVAQPWLDLVQERMRGLIERLVHVQSPRPGLHLYYRCSEFGGNQKLACAPETDEAGQVIIDPKTGKPKKKTLIELKGEGGYCLAPPSHRHCHPSGRRYLFIDGRPSLPDVPTITPQERAVLLDAARALNRWQEPERPRRPAVAGQPAGDRPGDIFNARATWDEVLVPHGWVLVSASAGIEYWRRPGKTTGQSASVNYADNDRFHVFSSNAAPFEDDANYTKFAAYTLLNHRGDYAAAARELVRQGYGRSDGQAAEGSTQTVRL